ncbi:MAG: MBOAT family protein [Oscillospiraceae bacterium]|nr:MBOAT family protein [Oscillospiraceae bacterium]
MIFADLLFLFAFLPLNLLIYFIFKKTAFRNIVLVAFSLFFYAWGEPVMVFLLIITAEINRILAFYTEKHRGTKKGKAFAITAVAVTLSLLAVFKYGGMFALPFKPSLPIGISFYSFQIISYVTDVYKGRIKAQKSRLKFLMYVSLYPQLIAGPIVRYSDIAEEIDDRRVTAENFSTGVTRFTLGLAKKVILANQIGSAAESILGGDASVLSVTGAWLGVALFALQIYYDFSGYSDMAIGLGRIFGFTFPENFNYPYISSSITEFWRRWHMTLGGFFRDYVYIPLGGGRRHIWRNLLITWFLTGLWHGASWNFALWGLYFGVLIIIEKAFLLKLCEKLPAIIKIPTTLLFVTFGWAIFYFTDFNKMLIFIKSLLGLNNAGMFDIITPNIIYDKLFLVIAAIILCAPIGRYIESAMNKLGFARFIIPFLNAAIIIICAVMLVGSTYNPFLYYRF